MKNRTEDVASLKDFLRINDSMTEEVLKILNLKRVNRSHEVGNLTRVSSIEFFLSAAFGLCSMQRAVSTTIAPI